MSIVSRSEALSTDYAFREDQAAVFPRLGPRPAVQRFIETPPAPQIGEDGYNEFVRQSMEAAFYRSRVSIEDTLGERIVLAWRITRELARHMFAVAEGETLAEALQPSYANFDPWSIPSPFDEPMPGSPTTRSIVTSGSPKLVNQILSIRERVPEQHWIKIGTKEDGSDSRVPGLPILPPDRDRDDPLMREWLSAVDQIASNLGLHAGSIEYPHMAQDALPQLLMETLNAWPTRAQIVTFEEILISEALDAITGLSRNLMGQTLITTSQRAVQVRMSHRYGLLPHESKSLLGMVRYAAMEMTNYDVDEARGLMILRLENFADRSRTALDLRAELSALKQLAIVQGLARTESGDLNSDFTDIVRATSASDQKQKMFE